MVYQLSDTKSNPGVNQDRHKFQSTHCTNDSSTKLISQPKEIIGAYSFTAHDLLGTGSFGEVYLVEKINDNTFHAMKVLNKDKILDNNLTRYALTE